VTPRIVDAELVILGAGCAGLSLAARLARSARGAHPGAGHDVIVVDPRTEYTDDRSWCFWRPERHDLADLVSHSWPGWRFSDRAGSVAHHRVDGLHYQYVRGRDFYARARERIASSPSVRLHSGVTAHGIHAEDGTVRVQTDHGQLVARQVVDTRPRTTDALLYQSFSGVEIESEHPLSFDPREVGLMDDMAADSEGMRFRYTLPFGEHRALVEWTRFGTAPTPFELLAAELEAELARLGLGGARVIRREQGVLAMGDARPGPPPMAGVHLAGIGGGALRAASGYGFLRIQNWARMCAARLDRGEPAVGHPPEPWLRRSMDRLFLQAVRADPERTPEYFMALARGVSAPSLVRFLSDGARPDDYARLIAALPTLPFIQQLFSRPTIGASFEKVAS
jgi:lycopene beta-cyclase